MLNRGKVNTLLLIVAGVICTGFCGCSGSDDNPLDAPDFPNTLTNTQAANSERLLWGVWCIHFDSSELSLTIEPARHMHAHHDVTEMLLPPNCDDCVTAEVNSFDPVTRYLDLDITLRNPYQVSGYDVRGIIYTNDYGHHLLNADDWTKLWEIPGGELLNPFKAFAKDMDNRIFANGTEHTENFLFYIPDPANYWALTFAVDASFPGNCEEPYEITNFWQEDIYNIKGASGNIYVDVRDWQGDVSKVTLVAPEITGEEFSNFSHLSGDIWTLEVVNATGVPVEHYWVRIIASSSDSGDIALYDYIFLHISYPNIKHNPVDVTPDWVWEYEFIPDMIRVVGGYAYVLDRYDALHIIDVSDSLNPVAVSKIELTDTGSDIAISNGYAYVTFEISATIDDYGLHIIDVDPPESAHIVTKVFLEWGGKDVAVSGEYAYVASGDLYIIDINPPESANLFNIVEYPAYDWLREVEVSGNYAFATAYNSPVHVINIEKPGEAYVETSVGYYSQIHDLAISNGCLFVTSCEINPPYLHILDINQPESAYFIKTVELMEYAPETTLLNGYAYVTYKDMDGLDPDGLLVIDIDPPEEAFIENSIELTEPLSVAAFETIYM